MEDDNSNDVVMVNDELNDDIEDKPIMGLFKQLISKDNKENTVLTNAQIVDILQREFNFVITDLHDLEIDIYLNLIKKFLKDWPVWDELDRIVNNLKVLSDKAELKKILRNKYYSLKGYLKMMLDLTQPMAKDLVKRVENTATKSQGVNESKPQKEGKASNDVILDVYCTREQLNSLFFRHPHPVFNKTIFNIDTAGPSRILVHMPSCEAIINWFNLSININVLSFSYKRETVHELHHMLVNKRLNQKCEVPNLNTCFQEKLDGKKTTSISKSSILKTIDKAIEAIASDSLPSKYLLYIIKKDLYHAPKMLKVPHTYRRYMNKYPYVRSLYSDVNVDGTSEAAKKYMLELEETISPRYQFTLTKWQPMHKRLLLPSNYEDNRKLYLECNTCSKKFSGVDLLKNLQQHILEHHTNEPDWTCVNCKKTFQMNTLADRMWYHKCTDI